jgi:pyruvate formate lyase activating enzyme
MDQNSEEGFPARYWHRLDDGRLQCDLCPRLCKLSRKASAACVSCVPATAMPSG